VIGLLKHKTPVNLIVVFVAGILLKLAFFKHLDPLVSGDHDTFLYKEITGFISANFSAGVIFSITYLLLFFQAFLLNRLMNDHRMVHKFTYLPAMAYLLVTSMLPEWNVFSAPLLANTLLMYIFFVLYRTYNQYNVKMMLFNIGLALGLAAFVFSSSLIFLVWVLPGLLVMRAVKLNEWMICLFGLITPFYLYAAYLLLSDSWSWAKIIPDYSFHIPTLKQSFWLAGSTLLILLVFLIGGYFIQVNLRRLLIQVRKNWSLMLIYLLIALLVPFLSYEVQYENWIVCCIPFASFHACAFFYPQSRWLPLLLFWSMVIFTLGYQYYAGWII